MQRDTCRIRQGDTADNSMQVALPKIVEQRFVEVATDPAAGKGRVKIDRHLCRVPIGTAAFPFARIGVAADGSILIPYQPGQGRERFANATLHFGRSDRRFLESDRGFEDVVVVEDCKSLQRRLAWQSESWVWLALCQLGFHDLADLTAFGAQAGCCNLGLHVLDDEAHLFRRGAFARRSSFLRSSLRQVSGPLTHPPAAACSLR